MSVEEDIEFEDKSPAKVNENGSDDYGHRSGNTTVDPTLTYETLKNVMVLNGYQFTVCRTVTSKYGDKKSYWRCIECKKFSCKGTLATIEVDGQPQIVRNSTTKHSHPPDYLAIEKRKFVGLLKKYYFENSHLPIQEIYDYFAPSMSPEIAQMFPSVASIRHLCRKPKPNDGDGDDSSGVESCSQKKSRSDSSVRLYDPITYPSNMSAELGYMNDHHILDSSRIEPTLVSPSNTSFNHPNNSDNSNCLQNGTMNSTFNSSIHSYNKVKSPQLINSNKYHLTLPQNGTLNLTHWEVEHVSYFLTYNGFPMLVDTFEDNHINGAAFAELEKSDLVLLMKIKVGYAIRLYSMIKQLRDIFSYKDCFNS